MLHQRVTRTCGNCVCQSEIQQQWLLKNTAAKPNKFPHIWLTQIKAAAASGSTYWPIYFWYYKLLWDNSIFKPGARKICWTYFMLFTHPSHGGHNFIRHTDLKKPNKKPKRAHFYNSYINICTTEFMMNNRQVTSFTRDCEIRKNYWGVRITLILDPFFRKFKGIGSVILTSPTCSSVTKCSTTFRPIKPQPAKTKISSVTNLQCIHSMIFTSDMS